MNSENRLDALFDKRLRALARNLPSAQAGDVKALHRTRVASRRVREALPLLDGHMRSSKLHKVRRQTRRITRALGRVRELDVALQLLGGMKPAGPADQLALDRVLEHLVREREQMRAEMLERLHQVKAGKVVRAIEGQLQDEAPIEEQQRWQATLVSRINVRVRRLAKALAHAGLIYLPDRLHTVRVAVKKLRYTLELAQESGVSSARPAIKVLKGTQDLLGQLHDVEVLMSHVRSVRAEVGADHGALGAALETLLAHLEEMCRAIHAQYLARRPALEQISSDREYTHRTSTVSAPGASTAADRVRSKRGHSGA